MFHEEHTLQFPPKQPQMFSKIFGKKDDNKPGEKVILHVYELGEGQQPQLPFGMGLYHSGVEVWRQGTPGLQVM